MTRIKDIDPVAELRGVARRLADRWRGGRELGPEACLAFSMEVEALAGLIETGAGGLAGVVPVVGRVDAQGRIVAFGASS